MERISLMILTTIALASLIMPTSTEETLLSSVLAPESRVRQSRSYYDYRYGRPIYDRDYDRPRCGRCDDRYDEDDDDDYDRRDRDDDRRSKPKSSKNNYDDDKYDDRNNGQKNSTDDDDDKRHSDRSSSRRDRDRHRHRDRDRHDDRDRYRPDYYDRFLRDPYRERDYDRPYRDEYYRDRRPYERYPYPERYGGYAGGYEGYASRYDGYRRPYEDYGGYGPGDGRSPHGTFRPWDETYRGQSGWDAGGRGYYFASGRPEAGPAQPWGQPEYARPQSTGWQGGYSSTGYNGYSGYTGQRDPLEYRVSIGYGQNNGYRQDSNSAYGQGYGQAGGWQSVGERRPYRDSSGVTKLDNKDQSSSSNNFDQTRTQLNFDKFNNRPVNFDQQKYGEGYGNYRLQNTYGQNYGQSSSTTETNYLFSRDDEVVSSKLTIEDAKEQVGVKEQ
ncbi:hypothetical protein K1T71_007598 [Dendrolimus kikuchii]|uniref:Uncharacterized protein n=1 Tax=Dendrolimus kikuchii TaxID=765133 RepID=A0ACC1CXI4_9NEOP|nr:hypothetical protein K1T71_007598 [Dendrolimus kikuchii]